METFLGYGRSGGQKTARKEAGQKPAPNWGKGCCEFCNKDHNDCKAGLSCVPFIQGLGGDGACVPSSSWEETERKLEDGSVGPVGGVLGLVAVATVGVEFVATLAAEETGEVIAAGAGEVAGVVEGAAGAVEGAVEGAVGEVEQGAENALSKVGNGFQHTLVGNGLEFHVHSRG